MFIWKLKKPLKSIFDIFPAMRFWNIILGLASFTTAERSDGVKVHIDDKSDKLMPAGVTLIGSLCIPIMFIVRIYPDDSVLDNIAIKTAYIYLSCIGHVTRHMLSSRIETFLRAFYLIEEIDQILRVRKVHLDYEDSRIIIKVGLILSWMATAAGYFMVYQTEASKELLLYHCAVVLACCALGIYTVVIANLYLVVLSAAIEKRFKALNSYLVELRKVLNEKMLTQELQMISIVHMKLCKSWDCTALSLGAGLICMHGMFQLYLLYYPLVCLGYLLPRIRNESMPFFFISMAIMVKLAYQIESLKQSDEDLKNTLVEFNLKKGEGALTVKKMCTTLLLQMEHVKINLVFSGFFIFNLESLLEGIKRASTLTMFVLQFGNPR